jgi:hypothetical protein
MAKFNKGDRVTVVAASLSHQRVYIGTSGTIDFRDLGAYVVIMDIDGETTSFYDSELVKVVNESSLPPVFNFRYYAGDTVCTATLDGGEYKITYADTGKPTRSSGFSVDEVVGAVKYGNWIILEDTKKYLVYNATTSKAVNTMTATSALKLAAGTPQCHFVLMEPVYDIEAVEPKYRLVKR